MARAVIIIIESGTDTYENKVSLKNCTFAIPMILSIPDANLSPIVRENTLPSIRPKDKIRADFIKYWMNIKIKK